MGNRLQLEQGRHLKVEGVEYRVTGGIEYHNKSDGSRWAEYCIQEIQMNRTKWLSVDNMYEEYAIYTQCPGGSEFDEMNIFRGGYKQADKGRASVTRCFGNVDTEPGDTVQYTEYEDGGEEKIIAVEQWEDETEYSRGYYLDLDEIVLLGREEGGGKATAGIMSTGPVRGAINIKKLAAASVVLILLGVISLRVIESGGKSIHKFLKNNAQFTYQTSITSDLNSKERADVYSSDLPVEEAVKAVIQAIDGETEGVQKSAQEDSVAILTKNEYCLVYTGTDQTTMVQISSRAYVYQSTNTPYRASHHTSSYYRSFYYTRGFWSDRDRYRRSASGYESYSGDAVELDPNDPYKSYSDSVRQSSINSRRSSGGGISSGK